MFNLSVSVNKHTRKKNKQKGTKFWWGSSSTCRSAHLADTSLLLLWTSDCTCCIAHSWGDSAYLLPGKHGAQNRLGIMGGKMKTNEACSGTGEAELWLQGSKPCAPPALSYARFLEQPMLGKRAFHQIQCASSFLSKGLLHMQMGSSGWKKFP